MTVPEEAYLIGAALITIRLSVRQHRPWCGDVCSVDLCPLYSIANAFCLFPECSERKQQLLSESFEDSNENNFCGLQHYWDAIEMGNVPL